jgi:hypothetical protein
MNYFLFSLVFLGMGFSAQEKVLCVIRYAESGSFVSVQRKFRLHFNFKGRQKANVPSNSRIKDWNEKFLDDGDIKRKKCQIKKS